MSLLLLHDAIDAWSLQNKRPFSGLSTTELERGALEGLTLSRPDLEVATVVLAELEQRSRKAARIAEKNIENNLDQIGHEPIKWLFRVRENIKYLSFEDAPNDHYTTSLYVILRDGVTQIGRYRMYVGQTKNTPEHRFEEHLTGVNSGRGLQKNGLQLMRSLMWPWQKVPGKRNCLYESALHMALGLGGANGPKISGDVIAFEKWPKGFQASLVEMLF